MVQLVTWSLQMQAGYGGHIPLLGRRLARHGVHQQDGKSDECMFFLWAISLTVVGVKTTPYRTHCAHAIFSRVWFKITL